MDENKENELIKEIGVLNTAIKTLTEIENNIVFGMLESKTYRLVVGMLDGIITILESARDNKIKRYKINKGGNNE